MIPFPKKKYNIVYADPPWQYSSKTPSFLPDKKVNGKNFTKLEEYYPTQTKDWIKNLPVKDIVFDDAAIFMWCTDSHLKEGIQVIESWGFKYITIAFVWEKKTINGKTHSNLGAWTMKNYEICLFGTRGKMLKHKKCNSIKQKVATVRERHSKKPDMVRKNIEKLFGDLPRIELFARKKSEGWDVWGNEC
jgi:site-specific DNA-methyltransferase (adenine-specific)